MSQTLSEVTNQVFSGAIQLAAAWQLAGRWDDALTFLAGLEPLARELAIRRWQPGHSWWRACSPIKQCLEGQIRSATVKRGCRPPTAMPTRSPTRPCPAR